MPEIPFVSKNSFKDLIYYIYSSLRNSLTALKLITEVFFLFNVHIITRRNFVYLATATAAEAAVVSRGHSKSGKLEIFIYSYIHIRFFLSSFKDV